MLNSRSALPLLNCQHIGFVMVFVPVIVKRLPALQNIRTKPPWCKAANSKGLIYIRGSFTSLSFHSASGSAEFIPIYRGYTNASFHYSSVPFTTNYFIKVVLQLAALRWYWFVRYFQPVQPFHPITQNKNTRQNPYSATLTPRWLNTMGYFSWDSINKTIMQN